jgi:isoleucyl-tRNA synthetase
MGIDKYNAECRKIVMRYATEWKKSVRRVARWIDMENDYKTLNTSFMESVWWVFRQLYDRQLVYRGFKVVPYSTACTTPLSNFEANLNYKDVQDPAGFARSPTPSDCCSHHFLSHEEPARCRAFGLDDDPMDPPQQLRPLRQC